MSRIAIVWPGYTGYLGPCFQALASRCELRLFIEPSRYEQNFDGSQFDGLTWRRVVHPESFGEVAAELRAWHPDVLLICGWGTPLSRYMAGADGVCGVRVLDFDMPWEWTLRKFAARWVLRPRLRRFSAAFVPGKRCARYARWLGFDESRIVVGSNPSGWERFETETAADAARPERFLFVGRFVPEKGLVTLLKAYAAYRTAAANPWPLDLVGSGAALPPRLPEGVRLLGFVRPEEMPRVLRDHACLVLPSRWEPWGVCAAEAMCAGLATVLSARCGIVADVRPTRLVPPDDIPALVRALTDVSRLSASERRAEGQRARRQMEFYSAAHWVERVLSFVPRTEADRTPSVAGRRLLHVVPGLDERANGIAVAAKLIAGGQLADGAETELVSAHRFVSEPSRDLSCWDEIWVHSMWHPETVRACRLVLKAGRPLVRMTHANLDPVRLRFHGWKKFPVWHLIERFLFARTSRVVVTCAAEATWCRVRGVTCPIETVDLKRFFDLDAVDRSAEPPADRPLHLLYVGRRHPLKGVDELKSAVAALDASRVELRLVHDHFDADLERDWAWCDVLCLPSRSENFGLVVAEALAHGKRVLTTDGAPAWEGQPGVTYVRGYRCAPASERIRLLREELEKMVTRCL